MQADGVGSKPKPENKMQKSARPSWKGKYKGMKEIMCDFENLYRAYRKAKSGKKYNGSTARFELMSLEGIHLLKEQLENRTYKMAPYNEFSIYEPKERVIKSCTFKDKVVQHCFCDNILMPRLSGVFITDNYAGQIGKGTLFGLDRLKFHMLEYYKENGLNGWILKCDISKFFYTIDHEVLRDIVDYYFPEEYAKWINEIFVDSTENPGVPLGNQAAQAYALLMLHGMDCMITGEFGIYRYGRYMDDFFLIHHNKEYLKDVLAAVGEMVESLGLSLNGKTQIVPFRKGITFLGFQHYITSEGKYIRKIRGENKRRIRKKIRNWIKAVKNKKMTEEKFWEKYNAWKNHASHGNCKKLCASMDEFVKELMENANICAGANKGG